MLSINDLKTGVNVKIDGAPYEVIYFQHVKMGRGGAVLRTKMKNLVTGSTLEKNYKGGAKFEEAELSRSKANFLYKDGEDYFFMDNQTFEQFSLSKEQLGENANYLREDSEADVVNFEGKPINIDIPKKMDLKVTQTATGVRGDTAQGSVTKDAILESGHTVKVPLFVETGDIIRVNTETGKYVERVKE